MYNTFTQSRGNIMLRRECPINDKEINASPPNEDTNSQFNIQGRRLLVRG